MIRSKEQLAVIRIYENTLVAETIHYPDEVRNVKDVPNVPEADNADEKELETAKMLIDQLSAEFDPEKYEDEYRTALLDLIEEKKEGDKVTTATDQEKPKPDNVTNLMDALQKSLDRAKDDKPTKQSKNGQKAATPKKKSPKPSKLWQMGLIFCGDRSILALNRLISAPNWLIPVPNG